MAFPIILIYITPPKYCARATMTGIVTMASNVLTDTRLTDNNGSRS